jgi:hypothetical protein
VIYTYTTREGLYMFLSYTTTFYTPHMNRTQPNNTSTAVDMGGSAPESQHELEEANVTSALQSMQKGERYVNSS